ncbi:MAG: 4-hydroxy-tetrahydrodipicolinate reductase [Bacteroidales bacterium]|nr:4-hydroxy-tetrahydrodipicolinate reductase [Bacteroidales bacterium]
MNIALIGYGKMGRTVEALGLDQGYSFPVIIDEDNRSLLKPDHLRGIDAAIEFSTPSAAPANILECIRMGVPVVSGTTGWNEKIPEIEAFCRKKNGTFFYASNFSIGVHILFALNRKLAEIMDQFPEYAVSMSEVHHVHKKDAPSGTALTLAQQIIKANSHIQGWYLKGSPDDVNGLKGRLSIEAIRKGEVKGKHSIHYESPVDSLTLSHNAITRDAFASGVLLAASFIKGKKGVFGMHDLLNL